MMIIYIAGLQAVPEDMLEAAKIDGANGWQTLLKVTIPNVMQKQRNPKFSGPLLCFYLFQNYNRALSFFAEKHSGFAKERKPT